MGKGIFQTPTTVKSLIGLQTKAVKVATSLSLMKEAYEKRDEIFEDLKILPSELIYLFNIHLLESLKLSHQGLQQAIKTENIEKIAASLFNGARDIAEGFKKIIQEVKEKHPELMKIMTPIVKTTLVYVMSTFTPALAPTVKFIYDNFETLKTSLNFAAQLQQKFTTVKQIYKEVIDQDRSLQNIPELVANILQTSEKFDLEIKDLSALSSHPEALEKLAENPYVGKEEGRFIQSLNRMAEILPKTSESASAFFDHLKQELKSQIDHRSDQVKQIFDREIGQKLDGIKLKFNEQASSPSIFSKALAVKDALLEVQKCASRFKKEVQKEVVEPVKSEFQENIGQKYLKPIAEVAKYAKEAKALAQNLGMTHAIEHQLSKILPSQGRALCF